MEVFMNILLQTTLLILFIFGVESHTFSLQEPLRKKAKKSWSFFHIFSRRETDTHSESSQDIPIDSDYVSEDDSSTRHSFDSDKQIDSTLNNLAIPDTKTTSQEFQNLHHELYPRKTSCIHCLLACYKKSNKD